MTGPDLKLAMCPGPDNDGLEGTCGTVLVVPDFDRTYRCDTCRAETRRVRSNRRAVARYLQDAAFRQRKLDYVRSRYDERKM